MFGCWVEPLWKTKFAAPHVHLVFGARQSAGRLIPIEVKWTEHPTTGDARHLLTFLAEHPKRARHGYVICRCTAPLALTDRATALPWSLL